MVSDQERRHDQSTREMIERVAREASSHTAQQVVPQAIETTLQAFGFKTDNPTDTQMDLAFLRQSRMRCDKFYNSMWDNLNALAWRVVKVVIILAVLGGFAALGLYVDGMRAMLIGWLS